MPSESGHEPRFVLRDARPEEAEAVSAVIRAGYAQFVADYPPESWDRFYRMVGEVAEHFEHAQVIVAEADGVLAGTATFYPDGSLSGQGEWPAGWAGVLRVSVDPAYRGRGIARLLMEEVIRRCREAGIATLALHTTGFMAVAKAMYERMGFVRDEAFDFVPRSGIYAYGYRLDVGSYGRPGGQQHPPPEG
jgi:GNAT superfamily N-acetyltransferase